MKEFTVLQGSTEWQNLRLGIPTASDADRILTAKKLEPSAQQSRYLCEKLAERILGVPMDFVSTGAMTRGSELESMAVKQYEFVHEIETRACGFCTLDNGRAGCSVDRFVGEDGILEVKNPLAPQHLEFLLGFDRDGYRLQRQFQLWVTGRRWVDLVSEFPGLPRYEERFERDEACIAKVAEHVIGFCDRVDDAERLLRARRGENTVAA